MNGRASFENAPSKSERSERVVTVWEEKPTPYGMRWRMYCIEPLSTFMRHNADDPETCERVSRLAPGESLMVGGGAAPLFKVEVS